MGEHDNDSLSCLVVIVSRGAKGSYSSWPFGLQLACTRLDQSLVCSIPAVTDHPPVRPGLQG